MNGVQSRHLRLRRAPTSAPTSARSFVTPIRWASSCSPATSTRPSARAGWSTTCARRVARADAPVLIDQEGGRVARLRPPHWRKAPPARAARRALCARSRARAGGDPAQLAPARGRRRLDRLRCRLPAGARHRLPRDPRRDRRPRLCRPARAGRRAGPRRRRGPAGRGRHAGDQAHPRPWPRHRRLRTTTLPRVDAPLATCWSAPTSCRSSSRRPAVGHDRRTCSSTRVDPGAALTVSARA